MGSYSELKLGSVGLAAIKNDYDPYLLFLFQESDKTVIHTTIDEAGLSDEYGDSDGSTPIIKFFYSSNISTVRSRLELMGYTKDIAEIGFYKGLKAKLETFEDYLEELDWKVEESKEHMLTIIDVLRKLTVEKWLKAFKEIQQKDYKSISWRFDDYKKYSPILSYMLSEEYYGFPGHNSLIFLRLIIDSFDENEKLVYDFTSLANGGWVDEAEDLISLLDEQVSATYSASRRFIIMTEGSSDTWIIQRSLKLLHPHLFQYFKFLDFEGAKIGGGAGMLANSIKAFAEAGIINRIIALFDNDTAASAAIKTLNTIELPNNIQIRQYPYLTLAENFPTIGPTGLVNANINGLACSIELYLGEDVLLQDPTTFYPVQWRGYDTGLRQYQGEILNKIDIQNSFSSKLDACEKNSNLLGNYDWRGVQLILKIIFTAFQEQDAELILHDESSF